MLKRIISFIIAASFITIIASSIIAYSRGYRFNPKQKSITTTGILSVSSFPEKASIYIDGKLTSASNASISLTPNWYNVRLSKEGYQSWEKKVRVQGEVVTQLDALLLPSNPSLRALTVNGVSSPTLSPSGNKVAYLVLPKEATSTAFLTKSGVWVLELKSGPLGGKIEPKQIWQPTREYDFKKAKLTWSPDEKMILLTFTKMDKNKETVISALQFTLEAENLPPTEVLSILPSLLLQWGDERRVEENLFVSSLNPSVGQFLKDNSTFIKPSPDETKILYLATASATLSAVITPPLIGSNPTQEVRAVSAHKFYVYDKKEDKNFFIVDDTKVAKPETVTWYSDSKHIVMTQKDTIYIVDYDGTNLRPVYSGPFEENLVFSWLSGGRLVILTNLNNPQMLPNFYEIDLR